MKKFLLPLLLVLSSILAYSQNMNLRINEIIAINHDGQMDDFFETDDWIEIYNPPGNPITNMAGYYLSDDALDLMKWQIPADDAGVTTMLPNSFKAFWIDDDYDNTNSQGADHNANFTLSSEGETLFLTAPDGVTIIDNATYPEMAPDISYGRTCDGCATWQFFNNVTFEDNNFEIHNSDLLFINEVQTINTTTYHDLENEYDQWVEIFNPNPHQVNLADYYLSVNGDPLQWQISSSRPNRTVIPAGGFVVMWCDNDEADDVNHGPFTLPESGATITLTGPDGLTNVDTYSYGNIAADKSYGRQSDGSLSSVTFNTPTPFASNTLVLIQPATLFINEVLSANQTDTIDNYNEHEDWFEVYNPGNSPVNIGGYYFSDNGYQRTKWQVPTSFADSVTVPAHGWRLFWADGDVEQGVRHADFRLSNNGEYLSMTGPDGFTLVDEISWEHIDPDTSYGRATDGAANWILFPGTTPQYSNNAGTINIEESSLNPLHVYPNPAHEFINFGKNIDVEIYSATGSLIEKLKSVNTISVSDWPAGIYFLKSDKGETVRLMKN